MAERSSTMLVERLTQRELEILRLIADGLSNGEIAERLVITLGTAKWYTKQIYSKLNVGSRTQAVALARTAGLLDTRPVQAEPLRPRNLLPHQATTFVGRTDELAALASQLQDTACRLLTISGPGGIGKTRLAIEAAR